MKQSSRSKDAGYVEKLIEIVIDYSSSTVFWKREWLMIGVAFEAIILALVVLLQDFRQTTFLFSLAAVPILTGSLIQLEKKRLTSIEKITSLIEDTFLKAK